MIKNFQNFIDSQEDLDESVSVNTERYQGVHGKKPSDLYKGCEKAAVSHFKKQGHIGSIHPQSHNKRD